MLRYSVILAVVLATAGSAGAQTWAEGMFDSLSRDFGSVPKGPVVSHPFRIVNNTGRGVRITGIRVSCGCVKAKALTNYLAPGQETAVIVRMDTRRFDNTRTVTLWIDFDRPAFAQVRLWVRANSRSDVSVFPETLSFGRIKRGQEREKTTKISLLGSSDYRILRVSADSNYVRPVCKMTRMTSHEVAYQLTAKLRRDTPPGRWFTDIWVQTNNPTMPKVRIPLTVEVESALSISPNLVLLGQLKSGTETKRKIIVRGIAPFRITRVRGADAQIRVHTNSNTKRTVHVLTVTFRPSQTGEIDRTLFVDTDLPGDNSIEFIARAYVVR